MNVDQINQAIRDNPLAAGLIGVGLFMTFFGSAGLPRLAAKVPDAARGAARAATDGIAAGARTVTDAVSQAAGVAAGSRLSDVAGNLADQTSHAAASVPAPEFDTGRVAGRAVEMKDNLTAGAQQVRERVVNAAQSGWDASAAWRGQLSDGLERQPLLLGAIGLAIGAGIASVLPATETERELVGDKAAAVRDEVTNRATRLVSDVKAEAAAQGLTPAAAQGALEEVARRAKHVATKARDKVANPVS